MKASEKFFQFKKIESGSLWKNFPRETFNIMCDILANLCGYQGLVFNKTSTYWQLKLLCDSDITEIKSIDVNNEYGVTLQNFAEGDGTAEEVKLKIDRVDNTNTIELIREEQEPQLNKRKYAYREETPKGAVLKWGELKITAEGSFDVSGVEGHSGKETILTQGDYSNDTFTINRKEFAFENGINKSVRNLSSISIPLSGQLIEGAIFNGFIVSNLSWENNQLVATLADISIESGLVKTINENPTTKLIVQGVTCDETSYS